MPWNSGEIGKLYDFGISVRPNPDGTYTPLACKNARGDSVNITSLAFMADPGQEQEESSDLVRKERLTQLGSPNVIDREFTLYPQITQGDWSGGELQKVFSDTKSYYAGRGLVWPIPDTKPMMPNGYFTPVPGGTQQFYPTIGGGYLTNYGQAFVDGYQLAAGSQVFIRVQGYGATLTLGIGGLGFAAQIIGVLGGVIYYNDAGGPQIRQVGIAVGGLGFAAPTLFGSLPGAVGVSTGGIVGGQLVLACAGQLGDATRVFMSTSLTVASGFVDVPTPPGWLVTSMDLVGSQLFLAMTDQREVIIQSFDLVGQTTTVIAHLPGYTACQIAEVDGSVFILALGGVANAFYTVDCYLLVGNSLQFISHLPQMIRTPGFASVVQSFNYTSYSNVIVVGPYAMFVLGTNGNIAALWAYNVQNGTLFRVYDYLSGGVPYGAPIAIATISGLSNGAIGGIITVNSHWQVGVSGDAALTPMTVLCGGIIDGAGNVTPNRGQVFSSIIDFTSAAVKLWRQIVVTHRPIANLDQGVFLGAWLDKTHEDLPGTQPDYAVTNNRLGSTVTTLVLNKVAKKLIYLDEWDKAGTPISVAIQAATGWVWTTQLAMFDNVMTYGGRGPADAVWQKQGNNLDAAAAINFLRQIWRLRGGLMVATLPNGETYNAVIQRMRLHGKQLAKPAQAGHPARYEGVYEFGFAEDL